MAEQVNSTWLIKRNGSLNANVVRDLKLIAEDSPVAVFCIIGVQSSGKSTLLNHLFGTDFQEMDAENGRHQTTKGIWVAKKPLLPQRGCLLVIDTEGGDGEEQEDDITFEKQTALFALAVSDTIVVNMWCTEVGRNQGARWPLLMIIFEVMLRICDQRKVTLMFVLRDKTTTPLAILQKQVKDKLRQMWKELRKPQDKRDAKLEDYFKIDVQAMSHYEHKKDDFKTEVADLKEKIISCSTSVESNRGRIAASGFDVYAKRIWDSILENKDLNLPRERIMVAEVRCNQIAKENYKIFCENESWRQIKKDAYSKTKAKEFGDKVNSLIADCLSRYDKGALYFDETIRQERRKQLTQDLLQAVEPIHQSLLLRISHEALKSFKNSIDLKEKYEKKGNDLRLIIQDYIRDFRIDLEQQFSDASIEHANWDNSTKQLAISEGEAKAYLDHEKNRLLNKPMDKDREGFGERAMKVAEVLVDSLSTIIKDAEQGMPSSNPSSYPAITINIPQPSQATTTTNIPQPSQATTTTNIPQPTSSSAGCRQIPVAPLLEPTPGCGDKDQYRCNLFQIYPDNK